MNKQQILLVVFLTGVFIGFMIGAKSCTERITTYETDTLYVDKPPQIVEGKTKYITKYVRVPSGIDTVLVPIGEASTDSSICMQCTFESDTLNMSDSAKIVAKFKPLGLVHEVWYKPAPEKIITNTITTRIPDQDTWSLGIGVSYGLGIGAGGGITAMPTLSLSLHRKLLGF